MKPIALADVVDNATYEKRRAEWRERIIAEKRVRRVGVGPIVSVVFENRDTVLYQIQEMLRAEAIEEPRKVQEEIDVYNPLLPPEGGLAATLFIEFTDEATVRKELPRLVRIEESAVMLLPGGRKVRAHFEPGRSEADRTASVHYLRFAFSDADRNAFRSGEPVRLALHHENYHHESELSEDTRRALRKDLES